MRNLYYFLKMARLAIPYKFRKYVSVLLFIIFGFFVFQSFANAAYDPNAKHSKWFHDSIVNDPTVKSSVEVKAQRTYPVSTLGPDGKPIIQNKPQKSTIKLGASASNVGKGLVRRTPAVAITYAVTALLGKAVDWVMDAENNRIKYKDPNDSSGSPTPNDQYYWKGGKSEPSSTALDACRQEIIYWAPHDSPLLVGSEYIEPLPDELDRVRCMGLKDGAPRNVTAITRYNNPTYDPAAPPATADWQYIPIDVVAAKVIANADAGHAPSMEVMSNTALDMLEAGLLDAQLEAAAEPKQFDAGETDPTDPTQTPTDPTDPTDPTPNPDAKPFELPPFCSWATKVCSFIDWMQAEPPEPPESGEVDVQIPDTNMHEGILERLYIDMPAQCPPDPVLEFMGARIPFPMSVFCQFAAMMKPLILLFAYIKGLSIIGTGLN